MNILWYIYTYCNMHEHAHTLYLCLHVDIYKKFSGEIMCVCLCVYVYVCVCVCAYVRVYARGCVRAECAHT